MPSAAAARERRQRERFEFLDRLNDPRTAPTDHRQLMRIVDRRSRAELGDWCALHFIHEPGAESTLEVAHSDPAKMVWAKALPRSFPYDPERTDGCRRSHPYRRVEFIPKLDRP